VGRVGGGGEGGGEDRRIGESGEEERGERDSGCVCVT